jgi:low affinity Fe/Cu permease
MRDVSVSPLHSKVRTFEGRPPVLVVFLLAIAVYLLLWPLYLCAVVCAAVVSALRGRS